MKILTIGQGEIGAPLTKLFQNAGHTVYAKDLEALEINDKIDTMIVSIPFKDKSSFVEVVWEYVQTYEPKLVVINSTVLPGTCEEIKLKCSHSSQLENPCSIIHSPVMGRHRKESPELMLEDIKAYPKFIGANTDEEYKHAKILFESIGIKTERMSSTKTSELAKLLETTYSGILIGWMQEVERLSDKYEVDWKEILKMPESANQRIEFQRPTNLYPGLIGGHCIMPNIKLLLSENDSDYLLAVVNSNKRKEEEGAIDEVRGS